MKIEMDEERCGLIEVGARFIGAVMSAPDGELHIAVRKLGVDIARFYPDIAHLLSTCSPTEHTDNSTI